MTLCLPDPGHRQCVHILMLDTMYIYTLFSNIYYI